MRAAISSSRARRSLSASCLRDSSISFAILSIAPPSACDFGRSRRSASARRSPRAIACVRATSASIGRDSRRARPSARISVASAAPPSSSEQDAHDLAAGRERLVDRAQQQVLDLVLAAVAGHRDELRVPVRAAERDLALRPRGSASMRRRELACADAVGAARSARRDRRRRRAKPPVCRATVVANSSSIAWPTHERADDARAELEPAALRLDTPCRRRSTRRRSSPFASASRDDRPIVEREARRLGRGAVGDQIAIGDRRSRTRRP